MRGIAVWPEPGAGRPPAAPCPVSRRYPRRAGPRRTAVTDTKINNGNKKDYIVRGLGRPEKNGRINAAALNPTKGRIGRIAPLLRVARMIGRRRQGQTPALNPGTRTSHRGAPQDELRSCADGQAVGATMAEVRAERNGTGNGRVYHIGFTADDGNGGTYTGTVAVCVPHDRHDDECVDDRPLYDSTWP